MGRAKLKQVIVVNSIQPVCIFWRHQLNVHDAFGAKVVVSVISVKAYRRGTSLGAKHDVVVCVIAQRRSQHPVRYVFHDASFG